MDNRRILIIDDDKMFTDLLGTFLEEKNVFVDSVSKLKHARQLLSHTSFDLILLDYYLPDGLGIELMSFLQQKNIDVPVLLITADDDQVTMQKCFVNGVSDYLLKPINMELLWLKMQRCFNAYRVEQQLNLQNKQLERMLDEKHHEEILARHVYRHLAESSKDLHPAIRSYLQSSSAFNGDFFITGKSPNGNYVLMLVDATGHGLAAAISVLPVVSAMRAMVNKGFSLAHLIHEINTKLYAEIPDDRFVACAGIEVNVLRQEVSLFNAGMPDILIMDDHCEVIDTVKADCLPLGILDARDFTPSIHSRPLIQGEHLLFYSDGLTEQTSRKFEPFSKTEFHEALLACKDAPHVLDAVLSSFERHILNTSIEDDVSVCYVNLGKLNHDETAQEIQQTETLGGGMFELQFSLSAGLLATSNLTVMLNEVLKNLNLSTQLQQKSFTIFSELINNGLDHGILELSSELKNDVEGFAEYLEERKERMSRLRDVDKLIIKLHYQQADSKLHFSIVDSGKGYEPQQSSAQECLLLSGRGLKLIEKLSEKVVVHKPGNITSVIIK
ncbi:SpoIIE family protein phosphatase [Paraglaciecola sp.]|uniref:SpoIIE family protein phosphatase n=1 Tax=Paraglaciecola sp. TaxID=1920173 RepID=UPI0030F3C3AD